MVLKRGESATEDLPGCCSRCNKDYAWLALNTCYGSRKVRSCNMCINCYAEKERPYDLRMHDAYGDGCGWTTIYSVTPKQPGRHVRLHAILHYELAMPGIRQARDFTQCRTWREIWDACSYWQDPKWEKKFRGTFRRGIAERDGNGIEAIVEDKEGKMWYVSGVWG